MTLSPERRRSLPMAGLTCGNRSPVTCHLRCGDACARPAPNASETTYFRDVAAHALNRRAVLAGSGLAAAAVAAGSAAPAAARGRGRNPGGSGSGYGDGRPGLEFTPIAPVDAEVDRLVVPQGYRYDEIVRWGDPILAGAPLFDAAAQTPEKQAGQFGYNCDYLDILETSRNGRRGVLVCNHEYTNDEIMFPPSMDPRTRIRTAQMAYGMSVVELERRRKGAPWSYVQGAPLNRRVTLETPFTFDGPARGSSLLRTAEDRTGTTSRGTLNNCSGGTTPWGTVLSGEENFNFYFYLEDPDQREARYGLGPNDEDGWRTLDPRWDATAGSGYENEPNRFGWIVELDPEDPSSTPVKHTAMGRFKHEGANVIVAEDGRVVAYMGDDERFDYLYRFVSRGTFRRGGSRAARRHNMRLLSEGDLSVARFTGDGTEDGIYDGTGEWLSLTRDGESAVPGMTTEEVLVYTRVAADAVQPTKMDRPEDVQPNLRNRKVYVACTNNTQRTPAQTDEANPRPQNKNGHVIELSAGGGDHTSPTFTWNILLLCGKPGEADTYFGGYQGEVSPIACPDNVAFDSLGNLWVSTDGQPGSIGYNDALHLVPLEGAERGHVQQFLSVPVDAETCGPVIKDRDGSVFVAVQHPGEDGTWEEQRSFFPDYVRGTAGPGEFRGPRPTVVQVTRR